MSTSLLLAFLSNTFIAGIAKLSAIVPLSEQIVQLSVWIVVGAAEHCPRLVYSEHDLVESVT